MYNGGKDRRGLRCRICTGCGLCPGISPGAAFGGEVSVGQRAGGKEMRVLARDLLGGESGPLEGGGRRLAAADIGTTTVAMVLYREDGSAEERHVALNPQAECGADVLSRVRAARDPVCAARMREQVTEVLRRGLAKFKRRLGEGERLYLTLAANTVMTYLLRGLDPEELGSEPFVAGHLEAVNMGLEGVPCFVFPGFSAFVGGDIAAGAFACGMAQREEITLLVDLGTNGEMMLGNRSRRIACATAAGPAFEGGVSRGVWGADMVSLLALLRREGILDGTGLLAEEFFETGIRAGNVLVTQEAVRAVQLAKAAVAAGVEILLDRYGISPRQVDRVVLAGGFGYYLKPRDAGEIGLLPESLCAKAVPGGNTALAGCLRGGKRIFAAGEKALEEELAGLVGGTEILNLAREPDFNERYIGRMELTGICV